MTKRSRIQASEGSPRLAGDQLSSLSRFLDELVSQLTDEERDHLALEISDVVRKKDAATLKEVLSDWLAVVAVRAHPDFKAQTKEYMNLLASGDIFRGVDLKRFA